jgi:hypothetical protein
MARESKFQLNLIKEIEELFPGCIILRIDPNQIQGFPDLLILFHHMWATLECKRSIFERYQPNQKYYIELLDNMSFSSMICPENKEAVLYELQRAFSIRRPTRFFKS